MKYLLNFLLILAVIFPCRAQKVRPALNLTKGGIYYMVSSGTSTISQTMNGQESQVSLALSFRMAFKVTDVIDTLYKMEVSYQTLDMKVTTARSTFEMDSRKSDSTDAASTIVAAMMDKPFNVTISKTGKIKSVENVENMISGVFDSFPQLDTAKKRQIKSQFLQSFGAKAFKGNLEMATAIFPHGTVVKNDKWVSKTRLESLMIAQLQTTYQLTDITGTYYQIHGDGNIATDNSAVVSMMEGLPVKYKLAGTVVSDIKVDKTTGWVSELNLKQLIKGNIEIEDNPKVPGGMIIPMSISNDQIISPPAP